MSRQFVLPFLLIQLAGTWINFNVPINYELHVYCDFSQTQVNELEGDHKIVAYIDIIQKVEYD